NVKAGGLPNQRDLRPDHNRHAGLNHSTGQHFSIHPHIHMPVALLEQARNCDVTLSRCWTDFGCRTACRAAQDAQSRSANTELLIDELELRERRPPGEIQVRPEPQWVDGLA